MPLPITPKPTYPNVPQAPGVPPVLRQFGAAQNKIALLTADAVQIVNLFLTPQWGLFTQSGAPALIAGGVNPFGFSLPTAVNAVLQVLGAGGVSVGEEEYRLDYRISTAPQEQGAFLSYNKVSTPFQGRVSYIVGGTQAQRSAFLAQAKALEASLDLLDLVMPEMVYPSCNVVHASLRRTPRDISKFIVDVWVEEVRVTGTAQFSNTQTESGAAKVDGGQVQPIPADQNPEAGNAVPAGGLT